MSTVAKFGRISLRVKVLSWLFSFSALNLVYQLAVAYWVFHFWPEIRVHAGGVRIKPDELLGIWWHTQWGRLVLFTIVAGVIDRIFWPYAFREVHELMQPIDDSD